MYPFHPCSTIGVSGCDVRVQEKLHGSLNFYRKKMIYFLKILRIWFYIVIMFIKQCLKI